MEIPNDVEHVIRKVYMNQIDWVNQMNVVMVLDDFFVRTFASNYDYFKQSIKEDT